MFVVGVLIGPVFLHGVSCTGGPRAAMNCAALARNAAQVALLVWHGLDVRQAGVVMDGDVVVEAYAAALGGVAALWTRQIPIPGILPCFHVDVQKIPTVFRSKLR